MHESLQDHAVDPQPLLHASIPSVARGRKGLAPTCCTLIPDVHGHRGPCEEGKKGPTVISVPPNEPVPEDFDTQGKAWEALSSLATFIPASADPP